MVFSTGWDSTTNQPGFARVRLGNYSFAKIIIKLYKSALLVFPLQSPTNSIMADELSETTLALNTCFTIFNSALVFFMVTCSCMAYALRKVSFNVLGFIDSWVRVLLQWYG
jgi:hypothetical protein